MRLIKPHFEIITDIDDAFILMRIEEAGRTCYKSENRICPRSAEGFVDRIIRSGHESVIEHESLSVRFICDRGVTHELVRHRLAAFSQESTRYCNYKGGVTFIIPPWVNIEPGEYTCTNATIEDGTYGDRLWFKAMLDAEEAYQNLLQQGWSPQKARSVLPNSLKTEIVMTANLREWRHVLRLRTSQAAHPQMRELMVPLCYDFNRRLPVIFEDIAIEAA